MSGTLHLGPDGYAPELHALHRALAVDPQHAPDAARFYAEAAEGSVDGEIGLRLLHRQAAESWENDDAEALARLLPQLI